MENWKAEKEPILIEFLPVQLLLEANPACLHGDMCCWLPRLEFHKLSGWHEKLSNRYLAKDPTQFLQLELIVEL